MRQRQLGTHGPLVSAVGLGGNNFGRTGSATESLDGTAAVIEAAVESGVTFIDTADIYGGAGTSERLIGQVVAGLAERPVIATKFGHGEFAMPDLPEAPKGSRTYIRAAVTDSVDRLGIETIDLLQQHTPDPRTPIEQTIEALEELVEEGTILAYGHSNFTARQIEEAADAARRMGVRGFVSSQDEYSLLHRGVEADRLPAARTAGLGFLPYFPLANGLLTGKFTRTVRPSDTRIMRQRPHVAEDAPWDAIDAYAALCDSFGVTMLEATFGWLLAQPGLTSVIAGATTPAQIRTNAAAAAWEPTAEQVDRITALFPADAG